MSNCIFCGALTRDTEHTVVCDECCALHSNFLNSVELKCFDGAPIQYSGPLGYGGEPFSLQSNIEKLKSLIPVIGATS